MRKTSLMCVLIYALSTSSQSTCFTEIVPFKNPQFNIQLSIFTALLLTQK